MVFFLFFFGNILECSPLALSRTEKQLQTYHRQLYIYICMLSDILSGGEREKLFAALQRIKVKRKLLSAQKKLK